LRLPDDLRDQLKTPLGNLVSDNDPNKENIIKKIPAESVIITVGDRTTENMLQLGLKPQIQIIDGLEKRNQRIIPADDTINTNLSCRNPPGEITEERIVDKVVKRLGAGAEFKGGGRAVMKKGGKV